MNQHDRYDEFQRTVESGRARVRATKRREPIIPDLVLAIASDRLLLDAATRATFEFEIYESGDPHSRAWDCSEVRDDGTFYRGDISGRFDKRGLVEHLRRQHRGCLIRDRVTGKLIR
jgi:hypothetical protein